MELKITKEKVLEAASKCSTAKATLETLFPECFEKEYGLGKFNMEGLKTFIFSKHVFVEGIYVKVPLPNCNNEWTFESFEWAKKFINQNPGAYVEYNPQFQYDYLYINADL